ncbi:hypothetical protein PFISCL1PPCAC_6025, partial [Pristionchus fissidentatus]
DRVFRVGYVNDNFPLLFESPGGELKGILKEIYSSFARRNGFRLEWILTSEYGIEKWNGVYTGLLGEITRGAIDASVERSYREDRIRNFAYSQPAIYQSDAYITRTDLVSNFSIPNLLVFSPLMILFITIAFGTSFIVEEITHVIYLRMRFPTTESFLSQLFSKNNPFVNIKTNTCIVYRFVVSSIIAGTFLRFIYTSAFTGSTVVSTSHQRNLDHMVHDIRTSRSNLIVENPSFLSAEKTEAIFGKDYKFPSRFVIAEKEEFLDHLCNNIDDYGKVNSFFLATVNPDEKRKEACEISFVATGRWEDTNLSVIRNTAIQAAPYSLLLKKKELRRVRESLDEIILKVYDFDKVSDLHWRRYTNRKLTTTKSKNLAAFNVLKLGELSFLFYAMLIGFAISFLVLTLEIVLMFTQFLAISKSLRLAKLS